MVYAFQGNAYQIGQYYLSPLYVWQGNAFQIGQYMTGGAGPAVYTLQGNPGVITLTGIAATFDYVPGGGPTAYTLTADAGAIRFTGAAASFDLVTSVAAQQAGRGHKPLRVRRKHYVEIDGQLYEVGSQREAEAILAKLHAEALDKARRAARKRALVERGGGRELAEIVPPQAVVVEPVTAEAFTAHLQERVAATNAAIAAMYEQINASAQEWMRREEDEDDVAVLLTMGIL